jgi:hypothetical protein
MYMWCFFLGGENVLVKLKSSFQAEPKKKKNKVSCVRKNVLVREVVKGFGVQKGKSLGERFMHMACSR